MNVLQIPQWLSFSVSVKVKQIYVRKFSVISQEAVQIHKMIWFARPYYVEKSN